MADTEPDLPGDGEPITEVEAPKFGAVTPSTVGTGSALAIGCITAVLALVAVALAVRWLTGGW
jgi:hypothetical protein